MAISSGKSDVVRAAAAQKSERADAAQLLIVDVQERLLPAMHDRDRFTASLQLLLNAARLFDVPATISEHYTRGLGESIELLREAQAGMSRFEKLSFSCFDDAALRKHILELAEGKGRRLLVIAGLEAHVCVFLSALAFAEAGLVVTVPVDAVASRYPEDRDSALHALSARALTVPLESLLFSW